MPDYMGEVPSRGCEVFVGKIPRDLFEDEIFPVFEKIGPIYELRLMMDFDGRNRGFCFVMFTKVGFLFTQFRSLCFGGLLYSNLKTFEEIARPKCNFKVE